MTVHFAKPSRKHNGVDQMSLLAQMPGLYLRGSLANVTMRDLPPEDRAKVEIVVDKIAHLDGMKCHKARFFESLSHTIGGEYKSDPAASEAEFYIAIWRATVSLFYHCDYTIQCEACGSDRYTNKRNKLSPINKPDIKCPNCGKTKVVDGGNTDFEPGQFVPYLEFQEAYAHFTDEQQSPTCKSPIIHIPGKKKYDNPDEIVNDSIQATKFFSEFVWNYLRQQLNENKRKTHKKAPQLFVGSADEVIVEELLSVLMKMEIKFQYYKQINPENGYYKINVSGYQTPPEFSAEFAILKAKAKEYGVMLEYDRYEIRVSVAKDISLVETLLSKPEHVIVMDNSVCIEPGKEPDSIIDHLNYKTIRGTAVFHEDHVAVIESSDVLREVRGQLPVGKCQEIFDIFVQQGVAFDKYLLFMGDTYRHDCPPKIVHVAQHLGVNTRTVNQCRDVIRHIMISNQLVPG